MELRKEQKIKPYAPILEQNQSKYLLGASDTTLGNVLLTGATGFLGIHVLREYLECEQGILFCIVRSGEKTAEERLAEAASFYFEEDFLKQYRDRIKILEGDITDSIWVKSLPKYKFDTIINCAACVKHFAADNVLRTVNVNAVNNFTDLCLHDNRKFIQISTISTSGMVERSSKEMFCETDFDISQVITNEYVKSKYDAEQIVLSKIEQGLNGKIVRVGNLMSRQTDGKFQRNYDSNGFMRQLKGYVFLEKFPISMLDISIEFSPIDTSAKAVLLCAKTADTFTVFHAYNTHTVLFADVIEALKACGHNIECVSEAEFNRALKHELKNDKENGKIAGLISYLTDSHSVTKQRNLKNVNIENQFTAKMLFLHAFNWPLTDKDYLKRTITFLEQVKFF